MLLESILAIAALVLQLLVDLMARFFFALQVAVTEKGRARKIALASAACTLYLVVAILRGFSASLALTLPPVFFAWPLIILAILFVLAFGPLLGTPRDTPPVQDAPEEPKLSLVERYLLSTTLSYALAFTAVFGGLSLYSSVVRAPSLIESTCFKILDRVPEAALGRAVLLSENLLDRELKFLEKCLALEKDV